MTSLTVDSNNVYEVATISPLKRAAKLSQEIDTNVYLKREDLQSVHSFKLRGAYLKMNSLTDREKARGVIAASAGNHAQGVALAAQRLGISALIVMPENVPHIKLEAVKSFGASVELYGDNFSEAATYCKQRLQQTKRTYIHPFDDPIVIAGQGTVGSEIISQLPVVTHIFVPVGGGGLLAGVARAAKALKPSVTIIGVESAGSDCMRQALRKGSRITLDTVDTFADGVAVKQAGRYTYELAQRYVDSVITVTNEQICDAIKTVYDETRNIVEPAGALAVAGVRHYSETNDISGMHVSAICSGANMEFSTLQFVARHATKTPPSVLPLAHAA